MMSIWWQLLIGFIALNGAVLILDTGLAMNRARDSVTRVNMASPAIYMGFPLISLALLLTESLTRGFQWTHLAAFLVAIICGPVGSAMGSMHLGRAMMLAQTRLDPRTVREDLRESEPPSSHCHPEVSENGGTSR